MTQSSENTVELQPSAAPRPYAKPQVTDLGALRDVTLGASPGIGDSGGAAGFKCPGCP